MKPAGIICFIGIPMSSWNPGRAGNYQATYYLVYRLENITNDASGHSQKINNDLGILKSRRNPLHVELMPVEHSGNITLPFLLIQMESNLWKINRH